MLNSSARPFPASSLRLVISILAIATCLLMGWIAIRSGFSRLLSEYAIAVASLPAADEAIRLAPADPEAHLARAAVLNYLDQLADAAREYEIAASLRPGDDVLWLELGTVRDQLGDSAGALAALNEAVRRAPYYAQPRWQRGNVLLRVGQYDEAFADLRQASASNRDLVPSLIDLAWGISNSDAQATTQLAGINDNRMRLAFARFLAGRGKAKEAIEQFRLSGPVSDEIRHDLVRQLISEKAFKEAFEIWQNGAAPPAEKKQPALIQDGGFERPLSLDEAGFGWRVVQGQNGLSLSVDSTEKQSGEKSLRIKFDGNSNPGAQVVSQIVIVEPFRRYRVNFAARTQEIVTGGLPLVTVSDAATGQVLGRSASFGQAATGWQLFGFEFTTPATNAVSIAMQRDGCASAPCPIFGFVWLDSFSMEEL